MNFIIHSAINEMSIGKHLGMPEYSYYFVLKEFRPVFEALGNVIVVTNPDEEVDAIYDDCVSRGESCLFISFAPPYQAPIHYRCPTITVFAWEFENIPYECWDEDPRNDWKYVFRKHVGTIPLSSHSARLVQNEMGSDYNVKAIPVPVWDKFSEINLLNQVTSADAKVQSVSNKNLHFTGKINLIDSRNYQLSRDEFTILEPTAPFQFPHWEGEPIEMEFHFDNSYSAYMGGFYAPETWGAWSRIAEPWILIPHQLVGTVTLTIIASGFGRNVEREIQVALGNETRLITLHGEQQEYELEFQLDEPANLLQFSGLLFVVDNNSADPRSLGMGLKSITIHERKQKEIKPALASTVSESASRQSLSLGADDVVYTSVLNPFDDRKNWPDLVTAFCHAFKDTDNAVLILKMTHKSLAAFLGNLHLLLQQLAPFKCRVIAVHGFLDKEEFEHLIAVSNYYVNASKGEGLCLPLMEFMSCGKPAIAPCNTAMEDYVDEKTNFVVKSSLVPTIWPHDPRQNVRTLQYRIDWSSLLSAYKDSYEVATQRPERYHEMAAIGRARMESYCSHDAVKEKVSAFLDKAGFKIAV